MAASVALEPAPGSDRAALLQALLGSPTAEHAALYAALNRPPSTGVGPGVWIPAGPFTALEDLVVWLDSHAEEGEVYAAPAWFASDRGRRADSVIAKAWIQTDIDDKKMPGATPEIRHRQARDIAGSIPAPHITIDSGGGFHVHALLPEAERVEAFTDPEDGVRHVELLGRALRLYLEDRARDLLGAQVSLDHAHGAERVWRVPPGWNAKAADGTRALTATRDRWRPVRLVTPGRTEGLASLTPANLEFLVPFIGAAEAEAERTARSEKGDPAATLDDVTQGGRSSAGTGVASTKGSELNFLPSLLPMRLQRAWPLDSEDQSAHDFDVAAALARGGWAPAVAVAAVRARRHRLKAPDDRAKGERPDYVLATVRKAYALAAAPAPSSEEHAPFPLDALPSELGEYVRSAAASLCCAPEAVVLPLLAGLGAAIGNSRRIEIRPGWSEPPLLWCCLVMASGRTKSPAQDLALRPLVARQSRSFERHHSAMRAFERDSILHRKTLKQWERKREPTEPPAPPLRPVCERVEVSDATLEAIVPILEENPRGVLLNRDELAGWMKSFDMYRNGRGGDKEQWLSAHRANRIVVDRKTNRETLFVPRGFIAACGGIQPGTLRRLLTPDFFESGLVARLLLAWPVVPRKQWTEAVVPAEARRRIEVVFDRLFDLQMEMPSAAGVVCPPEDGAQPPAAEPEPILLPLAAEARVTWIAFYNEFAGEQDALDPEDDLGAAFAKLEAYAARFALIFALAGWAASPSAEAPPTTVGPTAVEAGIVVARWFAKEAARIYGLVHEHDRQQHRRRLASWMEARGAPVTVRDAVRGPRRYRDAADVASADLEDLVRSGIAWRVSIAPHGGGVAVVAYDLRRKSDDSGSGDARSGETSPDKDLRERVSPPPSPPAVGSGA